MTGLDALLSQGQGPAIAIRLVVPPGAESTPSLANIEICRTRFGSGHAWDQAVLPLYAEAGVLSLGNFGPYLRELILFAFTTRTRSFLPESSKARHTNVQISQPMPTHIMLLIASAMTHGHGEEYRKAGLLTTAVASRAT